jgi:hypothetical protein
MDTDDIEDMLFRVGASPQDFEDATSDVSDDMLDEADMGELTIWDEADSPLLPTYDKEEVEEYLDLAKSSQQSAPKVLSASNSMLPARDR